MREAAPQGGFDGIAPLTAGPARIAATWRTRSRRGPLRGSSARAAGARAAEARVAFSARCEYARSRPLPSRGRRPVRASLLSWTERCCPRPPPQLDRRVSAGHAPRPPTRLWSHSRPRGGGAPRHPVYRVTSSRSRGWRHGARRDARSDGREARGGRPSAERPGPWVALDRAITAHALRLLHAELYMARRDIVVGHLVSCFCPRPDRALSLVAPVKDPGGVLRSAGRRPWSWSATICTGPRRRVARLPPAYRGGRALLGLRLSCRAPSTRRRRARGCRRGLHCPSTRSRERPSGPCLEDGSPRFALRGTQLSSRCGCRRARRSRGQRGGPGRVRWKGDERDRRRQAPWATRLWTVARAVPVGDFGGTR